MTTLVSKIPFSVLLEKTIFTIFYYIGNEIIFCQRPIYIYGARMLDLHPKGREFDSLQRIFRGELGKILRLLS